MWHPPSGHLGDPQNCARGDVTMGGGDVTLGRCCLGVCVMLSQGVMPPWEGALMLPRGVKVAPGGDVTPEGEFKIVPVMPLRGVVLKLPRGGDAPLWRGVKGARRGVMPPWGEVLKVPGGVKGVPAGAATPGEGG